MWTSRFCVGGRSQAVIGRLRASSTKSGSTISHNIARLNQLLDEMNESIAQDSIQKENLAVAIRDQYVQFSRPSTKPLDKETLKVLLQFADSSTTRQYAPVCIPQDSNRSFLSTLSTRQAKSVKGKIERNCTIVDFILSRDVQKGIEFAVAMREDIFHVRKMMKSHEHSDATKIEISKLNGLDKELKELLSEWFCLDMIEIRRISYDESSPSTLERIIHKEAVHPIENSQELRNRLSKGKRMFALFSPLLPERPLVFCHVALTDEVPSTLEYAVESTNEEDPKVATFYSITNGEPGLVGLQLGFFLLKLAMKMLQGHFPSITGFVTLSPMPNFRLWLESYIQMNLDGKSEICDSSISSSKQMLSSSFHSELVQVCKLLGEEKPKSDSFLTKLEAAIRHEFGSCERRVAVEHLLRSLASHYLLYEREEGMTKCRVARFHLGNGAEVHRINYRADLSERGMSQSFGFMVNYRYDI